MTMSFNAAEFDVLCTVLGHYLYDFSVEGHTALIKDLTPLPGCEESFSAAMSMWKKYIRLCVKHNL